MQRIGITLGRRMASGVLAGALSLGTLQAQELPTDQQLRPFSARSTITWA